MNNNSVSNISVYYVMYVILYLEHWWIDCKINITMTRRKTWRKIYEKVDSSGIFFTRKKQDQLFTLLKKLMSFIHSCLVFFVTKTLSLKHKNFKFGQFSIFWRNKNVSKNLAQFILQWIVFWKCSQKRLFFFVILGTF